MVESEKQQLDAELAHEQPHLDPQTALDALQLQVSIEHGGITGVKPEIIGAPKEWTARFNGKEINILFTPTTGRAYFLLKQPIDVAKLTFSADNKASIDLKIPTSEGEKRFTCMISKDATELAQLTLEPFTKQFPETIELGGAFAGQQTKRWGDAVMITPDGSDELASFVVDRTKLMFPGDTVLLPHVVSTNGAHLGIYKVTITRMRDKLVVTAEKLASEKIEKTQITEKIKGAPEGWKLTRDGKQFRILATEPGKRSYYIHTGRPVALTDINKFGTRMTKVLTHGGETYQVILQNTMGVISAELIKDDLQTKKMGSPNAIAGKFLTETYANKTITLSGEEIDIKIDLVTLHEQLLLTGRADAGSLLLQATAPKEQVRYDIAVTMQGDVLQVHYTEVTKGVRGVREKIELTLGPDKLTISPADQERISYRTAQWDKGVISLHNAKGENVRQKSDIDPALPFSAGEGGGGLQKIEHQRIEGRLRTVFLTNKQGTLNVDLIPELPQIKLVEIAEPTDTWTTKIDTKAYTLSLKHPTQGVMLLDLSILPRSNLLLHNGHAQGYITMPGTTGHAGGIFALDACNINGVVTVQCVPYQAPKMPSDAGTTPNTTPTLPEFEPQPGDIQTIYDETPPFWHNKEIGQWKTSLLTMDNKKLERFYVDYDADTNEFPLYFEDTFLGRDALNPDEELLRLDLKQHQKSAKLTYTDALRGANWEVEVTVDDKRILRVRVTPPKNLAQLIEQKKQNQQLPKIDRTFPELGDAFKKITTPEQLRQAREKLKELIGRIGEIQDTPNDLRDVRAKQLELGAEKITYIDKTIYPLGNTDPDYLKDMFVTPLDNRTLDIMLDTRGPINDSLCKVPLTGMQSGDIREFAGDDGTWKVQLIVDTKVINGASVKIMRVAVQPPQAWLDKQNPTHIDSHETPGKPFAWPLENLQAQITENFGVLRDSGRVHQGIDIDVPNDPRKYPPVLASYEGKVKLVGFDERRVTDRRGNRIKVGYGHYIILEHTIGNKKYQTLYGHLSKVEVRQDQKVQRGTRIGITGNSGGSSGAHLHFEVRIVDPRYQRDVLPKRRPIDPLHVTNRSRRAPTPTPRPAPQPGPGPAPQPAPNQSNIPRGEQFNDTPNTIVALPANQYITIPGTPNLSPEIKGYTKAIESLNGSAPQFPATRRLWRADKKLYIYDTASQKKLLALDASQFNMELKNTITGTVPWFEGTGKQPFTINSKQRKMQFILTAQGLVTMKMGPA